MNDRKTLKGEILQRDEYAVTPPSGRSTEMTASEGQESVTYNLMRGFFYRMQMHGLVKAAEVEGKLEGALALAEENRNRRLRAQENTAISAQRITTHLPQILQTEANEITAKLTESHNRLRIATQESEILDLKNEIEKLELQKKLEQLRNQPKPTTKSGPKPPRESFESKFRRQAKDTLQHGDVGLAMKVAREVIDELIAERGGEENLTDEDLENIAFLKAEALRRDESKGR